MKVCTKYLLRSKDVKWNKITKKDNGFFCHNWSQTHEWLHLLRGEKVSLCPVVFVFGMLPSAASHFFSDISCSISSWRIRLLLCMILVLLKTLSPFSYPPGTEAYIFSNLLKKRKKTPTIWSSARRRRLSAAEVASQGDFWASFSQLRHFSSEESTLPAGQEWDHQTSNSRGVKFKPSWKLLKEDRVAVEVPESFFHWNLL